MHLQSRLAHPTRFYRPLLYATALMILLIEFWGLNRPLQKIASFRRLSVSAQAHFTKKCIGSTTCYTETQGHYIRLPILKVGRKLLWREDSDEKL